MTIECRCPGCGGRFRAADEVAGRRVTCPKCDAVIQVPGPSKSAPKPPSPAPTKQTSPKQSPPKQSPPKQAPPKQATASAKATSQEAAWFVRTADDKQHGPLSKGQLDQLVAQGRLDAFCELRRADWGSWREIEEVYPSLALDDGEDDALEAENVEAASRSTAGGQASRVRPCPDCQQTVSRRAVQCPHCGCPLVEADGAQPSSTRQPPPMPAQVRYSGTSHQVRDDSGRLAESAEPVIDGPTRARRRRARRIAFLVFSIALLIAVVTAGIYIGIQIHNRRVAANTPVSPIPTKPTAAPQPAVPAPQKNTPLSAQEVAECKTKVADAMAREVDDSLRLKHDTIASMPGLGEYAKAMEIAQEMLDPGASRRKEKDDSKTSPKPNEPYQSQYEALLAECQSYLDKHVKEPVDSEKVIWNVGNDWVKMRLPERKMLEDLLRPSPTPVETDKQP